MHPPLAYRPDIDGLRAVAILLVVVYHAFPSALSGGFVGVDVFFVISGFLISTLIWNDIETGRFSFLDFYGRRARRIFPALATVLLFTLAIGYFLLIPIEYEQLGKHVVGGSAFVQNFVLRSEAGYFDTISTSKPLLHLWSLAIEEQFYLFLPLVLVLLSARRVSVVHAFAILALLSFAYGLERAHAEPERSFFNPLVRCWELLAGTLLAAAMRERAPPWVQNLRSRVGDRLMGDALGIVGLALILVSAASFDKADVYPSWRALVPVLGAVMLIAAGSCNPISNRLLTSRPMIAVGLISYSLYLWHWPLITFAHILNRGDAPWAARAVAVALSVSFAWLTYKFVESPLRKWTPLSKAATASLGTMLLCGTSGLLVAVANGLPGRDAEVSRVARAIGSWEFPGDMQNLAAPEDFPVFAVQSDAPRITLFVGDSNIQQYYSRVDELITHQAHASRGAIFMASGGCLPIPGARHISTYRHCDGMFERGSAEAMSNAKIDRIVIGASWNSYFAHGLRVEGQWGPEGIDYNKAMAALREALLTLRRHGKEVFLILNAPSGVELDPRNAIERDLSTFPRVLRVKLTWLDRATFEQRYAEIQSDLTATAIEAGAVVIRPADQLCTSTCNALTPEGLPLYKDSGHLNPEFVRHHAKFIDQAMLDSITQTGRNAP